MENESKSTEIEKRLLVQAGKMGIPVSGSIELLPLCNMRCDMCYVRLTNDEMKKHGSIHSAQEWIQTAYEMKNAGTLFLLLTGGEPLLYPEFKTLYLKLREMGMLLTINSNGTLIDEQWALFFGKNKPRRINISLYGADERAYEELCHFPEGFEKAMKGIRALCSQGVNVKLNLSMTKRNAEDIERLMEIGRKLCIPVQVDTYMLPAERERDRPFDAQSRLEPEAAAQTYCRAKEIELGQEAYRKYAARYLWELRHIRIDGEKTGCPAGISSFAINWQGEMHPCVMQTSPAENVFKVGFETAWAQIREKMSQVHLGQKCNQCWMRLHCRVCAASALYETGEYGGTPEYLCRYEREIVRVLLNCLERQ